MLCLKPFLITLPVCVTACNISWEPRNSDTVVATESSVLLCGKRTKTALNSSYYSLITWQVRVYIMSTVVGDCSSDTASISHQAQSGSLGYNGEMLFSSLCRAIRPRQWLTRTEGRRTAVTTRRAFLERHGIFTSISLHFITILATLQCLHMFVN